MCWSATCITGMTVTLRSVHLGVKPSISFCSFVLTLLAGTYLAQRFNRKLASPLDIDVTVRSLRTVFVASGIVIAYCMLFQPGQEFAVRTFTGFFFVTALILGARRASPGSTSEDLLPNCTRLSSANQRIKRFIDVLLALALLGLLSPLLVVIAALIRLDSPGTVLFRQQRIGRHGKPFCIFKFRSMHLAAPAYSRSPSDSRDPRITRVGRALRRLGIDELPQLINVVRGEMSLVGPRPEMPFIVQTYTPRERMRLKALPGITGLWQISPARALPIHDNLQYDFYYIAHCSLFLDLAILCRTASSVIRGIGAV